MLDSGSLLRAEGFFYILEILYGDLGIGTLLFLIPKFFFSAVIFFGTFGHQNPGSSLDPDPYQIYTEPKRCLRGIIGCLHMFSDLGQTGFVMSPRDLTTLHENVSGIVTEIFRPFGGLIDCGTEGLGMYL